MRDYANESGAAQTQIDGGLRAGGGGRFHLPLRGVAGNLFRRGNRGRSPDQSLGRPGTSDGLPPRGGPQECRPRRGARGASTCGLVKRLDLERHLRDPQRYRANSSNEERRFLYGERLYRLAILKLEAGEVPVKFYEGDYQGQTGYVRSQRKGAPVGMRESEWADSTVEGGPEALLDNLMKSGYPWHVLG